MSKNRSIVFCCKSCDNSILVDFGGGATGELNRHDLTSNRRMILTNLIMLDGSCVGNDYNFYPKPQSPGIPNYIPENIGKYLLESMDHFARGFYETSIMVCRKSLDLATKELAKTIPNSEKITKLTKRIHLLKDNGIITQDIFDWSLIIRDDGDEATHSDTEFNKESAEELINFTEMLLTYTFTLPKMVEVKRAKSDQS